MLYLTCTTITSVDLARSGIFRAKDWVSVDCGTNTYKRHYRKKVRSFCNAKSPHNFSAKNITAFEFLSTADLKNPQLMTSLHVTTL